MDILWNKLQMYMYIWDDIAGADLGEGCRGCAPPLDMKPSFSYWLSKYVYLTG